MLPKCTFILWKLVVYVLWLWVLIVRCRTEIPRTLAVMHPEGGRKMKGNTMKLLESTFCERLLFESLDSIGYYMQQAWDACTQRRHFSAGWSSKKLHQFLIACWPKQLHTSEDDICMPLVQKVHRTTILVASFQWHGNPGFGPRLWRHAEQQQFSLRCLKDP